MKLSQQRAAVGASSQSPKTTPPRKSMAERNLYTINEARERLGGISRNTIYELLGTGRLASVQIGRRRFVSIEALASFVASATTTNAPSIRGPQGGGIDFATMRLPSSGPNRSR